MKILLITTIFVLAGCVGHNAPTPKSDVKFTSKVGWWPYQKELKITSLEVDVVDSHLNLFNSKSLIRMKIKGSMKGQNGWCPKVDKVHISERVVHAGNFENSLAEITVTPVIHVKEDKGYHSEILSFNLTQEIQTESMGWGSNTYQFYCGSKKSKLKLHQRK